MSKVLHLIKGMGFNHKNNFSIKLSAALIVLLAFTASMVFSAYSENVNKSLADNLIRLHVIANSDSTEDQQLKRDVRDIIINYMSNELMHSKDIEQTKYIINNNMDVIKEFARREIARQQKDYEVQVMMGSYPFPTKLYGDISLPAGEYQALRVVIGKGEGANWWCVLFPPLCFVDASHGTIPESVKQNLKNALSEEEYRIITSAESESDIPVKVKFKVVEFFQSSKIKFSGMVSRILN